jgi:hypothetical protein
VCPSSVLIVWKGACTLALAARVAELADALALGASAFGRAGSNPALRSRKHFAQGCRLLPVVEAVFARSYNGPIVRE